MVASHKAKLRFIEILICGEFIMKNKIFFLVIIFILVTACGKKPEDIASLTAPIAYAVAKNAIDLGKTEGEFGGSFNLGNYDQYPAGSVTPVEAGRFYLARLKDGGFLAIYRRCTHLGCAVPYDPATQEFICPCHGSAFTAEGDVLNPPAPRPLDLFALTINESGEITVDTSSPIERDHTNPTDIVYA